MKDSRPGVLLLSGVPGAGKTTVSRILARRWPRTALIHGDEVHNLVVGGRVHPNEQPEGEAERQLALRDRNIAALADNLAGEGFLVIIDDVFIWPPRVRRLLSCLRSRPVYLALLAPDLASVRERDASRPEKTVFHIWSHLDAQMRRDMAGTGFWVDSTALTAAETAEAVALGVWQHGLLAEAGPAG